MASVKVRDRGYDKLMKRLGGGARGKVTIGIHSGDAELADVAGSAEHGDSGITVAELGELHEFGLGVPQRSFIRDWVDENEAENEARLKRLAENIVKGTVDGPEQALEQFGAFAVGNVQQRISAGIEPELADSTVAAKGSSTPLVDSGVLRSSIGFRVSKD